MPDTVGAVIVAAGSGTRMAGADKLFTKIAGRPLIAHAIAAFQDSDAIDRIVLVLSGPNLERGRDVAKRQGFTKVAAVCPGGRRRQDSVHAGLEALGACDYVAVHDGARPLVTAELIERGLEAARETGAAAPAVPLVDTVKEAGPDRIVLRTLDRSRLWAVQTPQVFRYDLLLRAHREVTADVTDDAAMVEALGEPLRMFEGDRRNVKVTTAEDLELVELMLKFGKSHTAYGSRIILHITTSAEWERAKSSATYGDHAASVEGFLHCSTPHQVVEVANAAFRGRDDLVLLVIDIDRVDRELRWEPDAKGQAFPHIYGPLNTDAVEVVLPFRPTASGIFELPPEMRRL